MHFVYNNSAVEIINDFNYLGVHFSKSRNSKTCKHQFAEKANKAMYSLLKKGRVHNLSIKSQLCLVDKLVKPILLYDCEIWGFGNNKIIEKKKQSREKNKYHCL